MPLSLALLRRGAALLPQPHRENLRQGVRTARNLALFARPGPIALRLGLFPKLRILTYPKNPSHHQALYKLCAINGYRIVTNPDEPYDLAVHFEDMGGICSLPANVPVVNRTCSDLSKKRVADVFAQVFGYSLSVDPCTYDGQIVEKSDQNYTHDGRILQGPLAPDAIRPGYVYQRFVDTSDGGMAIDFRTPLYGGQAPLVYVKRRPLTARFTDFSDADIRDPEAVFSEEELQKLGQHATALGLDYGEVDVLRDARDGRIYVVDVNNLPSGPRRGLTDAQAAAALRRLSPAFRRLVETTLAGAPASP